MNSENSKRSRFLCILFVTALMMIGTAFTASAATSGSWSVSKASYSFLTSSQKNVFNKAVDGLTDVAYKPVAMLARQTLADTNYVFLAQGTTATQKQKNWYLLTVCNNMKNEVFLLSAQKIRISSVKTNKKPRAGTLDGGWQIAAVKNKTAALPKKARSAFRKALKAYTGYSLRPIALLGTQVVAGTNYRILCYGKDRSKSDLFVITIYQDLKGKCRISACKPLKLESYIQITTPETTPIVTGGGDSYNWTGYTRARPASSEVVFYNARGKIHARRPVEDSIDYLFVLKTKTARLESEDTFYWAYYRGIYGWVKAGQFHFG